MPSLEYPGGYKPKEGWPPKLDEGGYWYATFNQYTGEQQTELRYRYKGEIDKERADKEERFGNR